MSESETVIAEVSFRDTVDILLHGAVYDETNDTELLAAVRLEEDKTLRTHSLAVGLADGNETVVLLEDNGSPRVMLYGYDGAAEQRLRTETSGELTTSLYGQDDANNMDALRTDPNRVLWQREYQGHILIDPVAVPNPEGLLYNPGAAGSRVYEVYFEVVNVDVGGALVAGVYIGLGLGGAAVVPPNWWMFNENIPAPGTSGRRGPFTMAGNDDIRGVAAVAGDASINFYVKRVDIGA